MGDLPREQYQVVIAFITKAKKEGDVTDKGGFLPEDEADVDEEITAPAPKAKAKTKTQAKVTQLKLRRGASKIFQMFGEARCFQRDGLRQTC